MASITTEFRVGLFVLAAIAITVGGYLYTYDGVRPSEGAYTVTVKMKSAEGLWKGTPVRLAGVDIGAIDSIEIEGGKALVKLLIRDRYELPLDSTVEMRSSGLLGDYYLSIHPGREDALLGEGGVLVVDTEPGNVDEVIRQVEAISEDVKAITAALREVVEKDENKQALEATLANVEALSKDLSDVARDNKRDIAAIVDTVDRLTRALEGFAKETSTDVDEELEKVKAATDTLSGALDDVRSITGKIDEGKGTIGALVNDDATIAALNETIDNANSLIDSFSGLRAEVYYEGRLYRGTNPQRARAASYLGNPLANTSSNTIGIHLYPQEDFWWTFEINDYPLGSLNYTETFDPDAERVVKEWERVISYRFTFMLNKRWRDLALRLGVKETGGGVGLTFWGLRDRVQLSGDLFDFAFGAYPFEEALGTPNLRVALRVEPVRGVWAEAGTEQVLLGARYGYVTGFAGLGFRFDDDDIKLLLATLPLNF